jgi:nucleoside-diphosphate-sugar epimerase
MSGKSELLLTGGNGFLGQNILKTLSKYYKISTLGRSAVNDLQFNLSTEVPVFDIRYSVVVHAAGLAHVNNKTLLDSSYFFDINLTGTQNLLKGLAKAGLPKEFVFISSVSVYGKEYGTSNLENENLMASDPYGLSKIYAEQLAIDWCRKNGVICTVLRLPIVVGKNPPGNLGAMVRGIKKGYYFNIGGGKAKKSMVLAEDIAEFIPIVAPLGGIYNLTDGYHPTFRELSEALAKKKVFNLPLTVARLIGKIGDNLRGRFPLDTARVLKMTSDLTFDDTKARMVGWNSRKILEYLNQNDLNNE